MRTQAIILKKIPLREHDQLVICYTKDAGKQTYQAKSIMRRHSKQASHLDVLNMADFSLVNGNGYPIITSATSIYTFPNIKQSLKSAAVMHVILECFDRLIYENQPDYNLWTFLSSELAYYENKSLENDVNWDLMLGETKNKLLEVMGYDQNVSLEQLAGKRLESLHFAQKVID